MNKSEARVVIIAVIIFAAIVAIATLGQDYIYSYFLKKYGATEEPVQVIATEEELPSKYLVDISNNYFEKQGKNQCSAYSCAFVLRHLGFADTNGKMVYDNIDEIIDSGPLKGGVLFKGLLNTFTDYGHELIMNRSEDNNLLALKQATIKGIPVIVLIGESTRWQHYTVVIGYDDKKEEIYFFDPDADSDMNSDLPGNRTYSYNQFLNYWNNGLPKYDRLFFEVNLNTPSGGK